MSAPSLPTSPLLPPDASPGFGTTHRESEARGGRIAARRRLADRLDHRLLAALLGLLEPVRVGRCTVVLPDGSRRGYGADDGSGIAATLILNRARAARRLFLGGETGFAEAYMDGDWTSPDLAAFLHFALRNEAEIGSPRLGTAFSRGLARLRHLLHRNSRAGSRRNIAHHYDLSNRFYRAWLGEDMTYSAALFGTDEEEALAAAQQRKYRNLARLLALQPDDHLLEIGCGWGSFALLAAREFGCRVTAITLSAEQQAWASRRVAEQGLADRITVRREDYRDVRGEYDKIASIEMFEAVGEAYWPLYFRTLRERLKPGGLAALQVITIDEARFAAYRRSADFIQRYIFPGGMLPTRTALAAETARAGLVLGEPLTFGGGYARTLALWNAAFQESWPAIATLGFDQRFKRMWEYYLAYCEAGFRAGTIDVVQFRLSLA